MMRPPLGVLRLHDLDGFLRADEDAGEVGVDHLLPGLQRQLFHRHRGRADAGVVEQQVEPAEVLLDPREQRLDRFRIADVGRHRQGLGVAGFLGGLLELVGAAAGQHHRIAVAGQRKRHRLADARSGPRHHRHLCSAIPSSECEIRRHPEGSAGAPQCPMRRADRLIGPGNWFQLEASCQSGNGGNPMRRRDLLASGLAALAAPALLRFRLSRKPNIPTGRSG